MAAIDPHAFFEERIHDRQASPDDYHRLIELLWEAYGESVYLYAYAKLGNPEDARDICQDAFVSAMKWIEKNPGRMPPQVNFPAWLRRIARNLLIDRFRRPALVCPMPRAPAGSQEKSEEYADWPDVRACEPVDQVAREEEVEALRECIKALPERRQRLVVMRDLDGRSYEDIAKQLAMPLSTVGVMLHRARKQLRDCVELRMES